MRHIIVSFCSVFLFLTMNVMAQEPTMVYDGNKLRITVPSGRLEFQRDKIENQAIRNCFNWGGRESCLFMAQTQPYVLRPAGLSTDDDVSVPGIFNGEPITIKVEMKPAPVAKTNAGKQPKSSNNNTLLYVLLVVAIVALAVVILLLLRRKKGAKEEPSNVKYDPNVISIITDESKKYERGLEHVKTHLNEYLIFEMDHVFADTAVNKVYLSTALVKNLY